jgi:hypothetical protein
MGWKPDPEMQEDNVGVQRGRTEVQMNLLRMVTDEGLQIDMILI